MKNKNRMILALAAVAMMFAVCFVGFSMVSDDGADADTTYVASVTIGSTTTNYETIESAVAAAQPNDTGNDATITLLANTTTSGTLSFTKPGQYILDIGTYTLTQGNNNYMITLGGSSPPVYPIDTINTSAQLTIKGTGNIVAKNTTFRSYGTMIFGESGTGPKVTMGNSNHERFSIFKVEEGSYLTVNGGEFSLGGEGNKVTRIMQNWGTTVINGGTFNADLELFGYTPEGGSHYTSTVTINDGIINGKLLRKNGTKTTEQLTDADQFIVKGGSFSDLSGLPYVASGEKYTLNSDCTVASDVKVLNSTTLDATGKTITIGSGVKFEMADDAVFSGTIAGPSNNKLVADKMKAGTGGITITGGSLLIDGVIVPEGTTTVSGATITVSGDDITVSGKLDSGAELLVTKDESTKVVFKDFEQESGTKVEFEKSDGSKTTDPVQAGANISLGKNVTLTDLKYKTKDVASDFAYTGSAQTPGTDFPGIEAITGYTIESTTILEKGDYDTDPSGATIIKTQTDVGSYVIYYEVKVKDSADVVTTYEVKRSWSITPIDVTITGSVTKTYNGNSDFDSTGLTFSPDDKITFVSAGVASKDVGTYDLDLIVSSAVPISNFRIMYGTTVLTPVVDGTNYKLVLPGAATITVKALTSSMATAGALTYDRSVQDVVITVEDGGTTLVKDVDYTLGGTIQAQDVGTSNYTATANGIGNYTGTLDIPWNLTPKTIDDTMVSVGTLTYDGTEQTVAITVTDGSTTLIENTGYTLGGTLKATDVSGTGYTATVTGKGNYQGTVNKVWNIAPKDVSSLTTSDASVTVVNTGSGEKATVTMTVKDGSTVLVLDTDYTLVGLVKIGVDKYKVSLNGQGNYVGTKDVTDIPVAKSFYSNGAAFYSDADIARLAMQMSEITYTGPVKDKNIVFVYYQKGFSSSDMYGSLYSGALPVLTTKLENDNGRQVWLIEDDDFTNGFVNGGKYTLVIEEGSTKIFEVDVTVNFPVHPLDYYVIDSLDYDYKDYDYVGDLKADGGSVTVTYVSKYMGTKDVMNDFARYMGALYYNSDGEVTSVYFDGNTYTWNGKGGLKGSNWYDFTNNKTLVSAVVDYVQKNDSTRIVMEISNAYQKQSLVYGAVFMNGHTLGYYVQDALNYVYDGTGYTYKGAFDVDAGSVKVTYVGKPMERATDAMNDFARYMGALYYNSDGEVTGVYFNGNFYEWNAKGTLKGSNWYDFTNRRTLVQDVMSYVSVEKMEVVMEIYGVSERQSLTYSVMFAKAFYDVTITGEGVAYYLDGLRFPAGVYSLAEGKYTLVMEVLPGYEGTPSATGVVDGVFEVTGKMTIEVTGVKVKPAPVMYKVTLASAGEITVMAGETITLPTLSKLGETFIGWSETKGGEYGIQGFYTPTKDIELHPVFAAVKSYNVTTDYTGTDVVLAYNKSITDGSFGLLVVTKTDPKTTYEITLTNASLAMLGEGSYMIVGATGDVNISVTTKTMEPSGFESFSILGALADNKGFRVEMKAKDMGGLFEGKVTLTYTYTVERSGETYYASTVSDPVDVKSGDEIWSYDYKITDGTMYYAYATYTYTSGTTDYKFQTLGVVAPSIPSVTP